MDFEKRFFDEVASISHRYPGYKIVYKRDSVLCKVLAFLLLAITFGKLDFYLFHSQIGKTMYAGDSWKSNTWAQRWCIIVHERVHLDQIRICGLGLFWLGFVVFAFAYMFLLPFGLTLRSRFELAAYRTDAIARKMAGCPLSRRRLFELFTGPSYVWMCLSRQMVSRWLDSIPELDP